MPVMTSLDSPAYTCPAYTRYQEMRTVVRDCSEGTPRMREKAATYLPRGPAEQVKEWERRVYRTEFFNGLMKTVKGLVGMVFRKNPRLGADVATPIKEHWENIDLRGTHGDVFSRSLFRAAMLDGFSAILVDYAAVPDPDQITLAEQRAREYRPYWVKVDACQITSWRVEYENGKEYLSLVVIIEKAYLPDGLFAGKERKRWRVFRRVQGTVTWELWEESAGQGSSGSNYSMIDNGIVRGPTQIPIAFCYTNEHEHECEVIPPLLDLAYTNIAHFQVRSDHRHSLHIASVPLLVFKGRDKTKGQTQEVGPNVGIDVAKDGDVKYAEHQGTALEATRNELKDLEGQMAALGLSMLQNESRAAETAEAKRLDKAEQDSALATAARGLQDCLELALKYHAEYMGLGEGTIEVNQEFEHLTIEAGQIEAFSRLHQASQISLDTLWAILEAGNALPDDFDPEEEKARIADEMPEPEPLPNLDANGNPIDPNAPPPGGQPKETPPADPPKEVAA